VGEELPREPHKLEKLVRLQPLHPGRLLDSSLHAIRLSIGRTSASHADVLGSTPTSKPRARDTRTSFLFVASLCEHRRRCSRPAKLFSHSLSLRSASTEDGARGRRSSLRSAGTEDGARGRRSSLRSAGTEDGARGRRSSLRSAGTEDGARGRRSSFCSRRLDGQGRWALNPGTRVRIPSGTPHDTRFEHARVDRHESNIARKGEHHDEQASLRARRQNPPC
jgi:hypothetical protein